MNEIDGNAIVPNAENNVVENNIEQKKSKTKKLPANIYSTVFISLGCQILTLVLLLLGVGINEGARVTPIGAINLILSVLSIGVATISYTLIKTALGIAYIIILVSVIKQILLSVKTIFALFSSNNIDANGNKTNAFTLASKICNLAMRTCLTVLTFSWIVVSISGEALKVEYYLLALITCGMVITSTCALNHTMFKPSLSTKYDVTNLVFVLFRNIIIAVLLLLVVKNFSGNHIVAVMYGVEALLKGALFSGGVLVFFCNFYALIVSDLLIVILGIMILRLAWDYLTNLTADQSKYTMQTERNTFVSIVVYVFVVAIVHCVMSAIMSNVGGGVNVTVNDIFVSLRNLPSVYVISLVTIIVTCVISLLIKYEKV